MNELRRAFLDVSRISLPLLATPEVEQLWIEPSALPEMSVRSLAGHLARCTSAVERYLDQAEPDEPPISAGAYYALVLSDDDIFSDVHVGVRATGEKEAAAGHGPLVVDLDNVITRLEPRLEREDPARRVRVFNGLVLHLDDYLKTRIVELVVHIDDLAVSVGLETPEIPEAAHEVAMATMLEVALERHGPLAVVRAMARRERDDGDALRVF